LRYVWAFIVGGLLCVIAQVLIDRTKLTPARILVSYVVVGVVLTAVGVYEPLIELAGNGASTPLSGVGYQLATGVEKAVDERGLVGALTGGISATAAGITAAMVSAVVCAVLFRGKPK